MVRQADQTEVATQAYRQTEECEPTEIQTDRHRGVGPSQFEKSTGGQKVGLSTGFSAALPLHPRRRPLANWPEHDGRRKPTEREEQLAADLCGW